MMYFKHRLDKHLREDIWAHLVVFCEQETAFDYFLKSLILQYLQSLKISSLSLEIQYQQNKLCY